MPTAKQRQGARGEEETAAPLDAAFKLVDALPVPVYFKSRDGRYLGVNRAIDAVRQLKEKRGRLGVFWHTQGSGKSLSMMFFSQKILRTLPGNWTFVVVTDRDELDDQIYKEFVACGAITEKQAQATSGENLRQLLTEDHRYVFTLIQKFHTEKGNHEKALSLAVQAFQQKFVHIPESTAKYLAGIGVQTVGVDYLSVGAYDGDGVETHRALLGAGVWIIEGLILQTAEPGDYELVCLPLKLAGSDGAPARAVLRPLRK